MTTPARALSLASALVLAIAAILYAQQANYTMDYVVLICTYGLLALGMYVPYIMSGGLSLEESIAAFEEGIRLARAGAAKLEEAERKVELLLENDRVAPFGGDDGSRR